MKTYKTKRYSLVVLGILCYFFSFAGRGLRADLSHDDLMNLYKSWYPPASAHIADIIAFFKPSESFRPLGSLFYRILFEVYGMQALPYRIACYSLILLNMWLAYCVVRRLTNSREVAVITVVLFSYHMEFWPLYLSTGFCYDLLCFCFYMGAFLYYLRHRHASWTHMFVWSILYVLCLDSKELGVTLPVVICIYELLRRRPSTWISWIAADAKIPLAGIAINLLFIGGRVYGHEGLSKLDGYIPVYRPGVYFARAYHFLSDAFYAAHWLTPATAALLFSLLAAMAIWSRWFPLRFAVASMPVAILPVAFIPERGLASATPAALALAITVALVLTEISRWLFHRFRERQAAQFVAVLLIMVAVNGTYGTIDYQGHFSEGKKIRSIYDQIRTMQPVFPHDSNVLFLHDPFSEMTWATSFIVALHSKDPSVRVYRLDRLPKDARRDFNIVFSYEKDRLAACAIDWLDPGTAPSSVCSYPAAPDIAVRL